MSTKNIALYFGSFNPVHFGHLLIAGHVLEFENVHEVWFVISPQNPFKLHGELWSEKHRFNMVALAIEDEPHMQICDVEFSMPQPSYTYDTLCRLKVLYPQHSFSLIMGEDNLEGLLKWKEPEYILKNHILYVYPRTGYEKNVSILGNVIKMNAPLVDISATEIRKLLKAQKKINHFVPPKVVDYLFSNKLNIQT